MDKPKKCVCGKDAKFYMERFKKSFCSDDCLVQFQIKDDPNGPHVVIMRKETFFQQGDVRFTVYKDLCKTLGISQGGVTPPSVLDGLMDSQIITLARANGLPVDPFVRHLVRSPLHGVIQLAHYAAMQEPYDRDHLLANQEKRVKEYLHQLAEWKPGENGSETRKTPQKAIMLSHTYRITQKAAGVPRGRASQVLEVLKTLNGKATLAQIIDSAKGKVKTKQDVEKIVTRFVKELLEVGAVEEVK